MGQALSFNISKQTIDVSLRITNSFIQQVTTYGNQSNKIKIDHCKDVTIDHVWLENYATVDIKAFQEAESQSAMTANIEQELHQYAQSVTQWLGLSSEVAFNYSKETVKLGLMISNRFSQTCATKFSQQNAITCYDSTGVTLKYVEFKNVMESVTQCTLNDQSISNQKAVIEQIVQQSAKAKEASFWAGLIAIAAIVGITIFAGASAQTGRSGEMFAILLVIVVVIYVVSSFFL